MDENQRKDHVERMRNFVPTPTTFYTKPANVGKKPGERKRNRNFTDPLFVEERIIPEKIPKMKVTKTKNNNYTSKIMDDFDLKKLNPKERTKQMELRLKSMHKQVTK